MISGPARPPARADHYAALVVPVRLILADGICAGGQVVEAVAAFAVCRCIGDDLANTVDKFDSYARERPILCAKDAIVLWIGVDAAGDRAGDGFAEVVVHAVGGRVQHDLRDDVGTGDAAGGADDHAALIVAVGLVLANGVCAGGKIVEAVATFGVGQCRADDLADAVEQVDFHARERPVLWAEDAVVLRVGVDAAGDRAGDGFAEVVVHRVQGRCDGDLADHVGRDDDAAGAAEDGRALEVAGRLCLADFVLARGEVVELVLAFAVGERRGDDDVVLVEQLDLHAGQRNVLRTKDAILFGVGIHAAGKRAGDIFAEVVVDRVFVGADLDLRDVVVAGDHAAARADVLVAIVVAVRLQLADAVDAGLQVVETVAAFVVSKGSADDVALCVEQLDRNAGERNIERADDAVAFGVGVNAAADAAGQKLPEIVAGSHCGGPERDLRDEVVGDSTAV